MTLAKRSVIVAPLEEADIPTCVEIMTRSLPWTRYPLSEDSIRALWQFAWTSGATVAVARVEGKTAGFSWYIERGGFGLSGYLKLLGVHPGMRSRGVGGVLLEHTERLTLASGSRDLLLMVSDFNLDAQEFYHDHGYTKVGGIPDYVAPGITELILRKRLAEDMP
jgi:ribosomal protein S18 acetylase RimI-like enzyme